MESYKKWQMQCLAEEAVEILTKSHYDACYAENLEEALKIITGMIPEESSVTLGGSQTLSEMGILEVLSRGNYKLFDRYQDLPHEEIVEIMRQSLPAAPLSL